MIEFLRLVDRRADSDVLKTPGFRMGEAIEVRPMLLSSLHATLIRLNSREGRNGTRAKC